MRNILFIILGLNLSYSEGGIEDIHKADKLKKVRVDSSNEDRKTHIVTGCLNEDIRHPPSNKVIIINTAMECYKKNSNSIDSFEKCLKVNEITINFGELETSRIKSRIESSIVNPVTGINIQQ